MKSGSLNLLEPLGSVQVCNGIALPFLYYKLISFKSKKYNVYGSEKNCITISISSRKETPKLMEQRSVSTLIYKLDFCRIYSKILWYHICTFITHLLFTCIILPAC